MSFVITLPRTAEADNVDVVLPRAIGARGPGPTEDEIRDAIDGRVPLTPMDFGAKGDGSNCAQALQALFESSGDVMIPDGEWWVGSPVDVTLRKSFRLRSSPRAHIYADGLDGTAITLRVPSDGAGLPSEGITIDVEGGFWDASKQKVSTSVPFLNQFPAPEGLQGSSSSCTMLAIVGRYTEGGVVKAGVQRAKVSNAHFFSARHWVLAGGDTHIAMAGVANSVVCDNVFEGARDLGLYVNSDETGLLEVNSTAYGNRFLSCFSAIAAKRSPVGCGWYDNTFINCVSPLGVSHLAGPGPRDCQMYGNRFVNCQRSITLTYSQWITVHDNIFRDAGAYMPDGVTPVTGTYDRIGVDIKGCTNCLVYKNLAPGMNTPSPTTSFILLSGYTLAGDLIQSTYNTIEDNVSSGWGRPVTEVDGEADYNTIPLSNVDTDPEGGPAPIRRGDHPQNVDYKVVAFSAIPIAHTGTTEATTLFTMVIPGRTLGKNGSIRVTSTWTGTADTSDKRIRIRYGGNLFVNANVASSTNGAYRHQVEISNQGDVNSQSAFVPNSVSGWGSSDGTFSTASINSDADQSVDIQASLTDSTDTLTLQSYRIEILAA